MIKTWCERVRELKTNVLVLYLACRDPRTPWYARAIAAVVVSYALSPIDLIPDFIPVLGALDDLILVPLGLLLAIRLIPENVMVENRAKADEMVKNHIPLGRSAAIAIIILWIGALYLLVKGSLHLYQLLR